jgi:Ca2+/Na+ antiporter
LFKDFSDLTLTANWFTNEGDVQFTSDLVASVLLFYLIYLFHKQRIKINKSVNEVVAHSSSLEKFINAKKGIATALVPILLVTAIYSFIDWGIGIVVPVESDHVSFKDINNIFFEQFFSILIIAEVILLLFSFFHTDEFHKVIRNSGFIISTILIRISFSVDGLVNTLLIVFAVIFGLLMLYIHNKYENMLAGESDITNKTVAKESNEIE